MRKTIRFSPMINSSTGEDMLKTKNSETIVRINNKQDWYFVNTLTKRELETLQLFADGLNSTDIAKLRGKSKRTIDSHMANLKSKLNADTITHAVAIGFRNKIIT